MAKRSPAARQLYRFAIYPLQGVVIWAAYLLCRSLPLEWASAAGGFVFRTFGSRMKVDRIARRNLRAAYPDMPDAEFEATIRGMWDNLGRGAAECCQLDRFDTTDPKGRVEVVNGEAVGLLREDGQPGILISGHIANWEVTALAVSQRGVPLGQIFRSADNPWINKLFWRMRSCIEGSRIPKGRQGAVEAMKLLKSGRHLGLLVDQKLNEGEAIPFFGRDAMTATAPAALALRFRCPLVPAQVIRLPGVRFRIIFHEPLAFPDTGNRNEDIRVLLTEMNRILEEWIRQHPEQWFWVHRRWPDS